MRMSTGRLCAPAGVVAPQSSVVNNRGTQHPTRVEWPTIVVAVAVWAMWIGLVFGHASIPWPLSLLGLGLAGGWYMSLQHEVLHGHPTPWGWLNVALAGAPLSLWLPYWLYRDEHLLHHEVALTIPDEDPESFYVSPAHWAHAGPVRRATLRVSRTFIGRLLIGPLMGPPRLLVAQARAASRDGRLAAKWLGHIAGAVVVGWVVFGVAGMPVWQYLIGYCWFGMSVSYTRSFVEHRAVPAPATRSAVVRSGWFFGVLFLFNNLHHTHHARPGAAWYTLPALTEQMGSAEIARDGAGLYRGYREIVRRFAFRPFDSPVHPLQ